MANNREINPTEELKAVPPTHRFVASNRRAGKLGDPDALKRSRDSFEQGFSHIMAASVTVLAQNEGAEEAKRGIRIFDADYQELRAMKEELPADLLIEPLITRKPAVAQPFEVSLSSGTQPLGKGAKMEFYVKDGGKALPAVGVTVNFMAKGYPAGAGSKASDVRETDAAGRVVFEYDASVWTPASAIVEPPYGYWSPAPMMNPTGGTIKCLPLPRTGPLGWWHNAVGIYDFAPTRGAGIKIGVIDTGVGPNPYLGKVTSIGSFIDGGHDPAPKSGQDVRNHGSHVCGIIAALPPTGSRDYAGIAPGAEVHVARVFPKDLSATQADIANAIDTLAVETGVHLINMSLGSEVPSAIELDAIRLAMEHGTLCVCAAGNNNGSPVCYPAAHSECVAVSGLGLTGVYPPGTLSAYFTPTSPDRFGAGGLFLASYSNIGNEIVCCAPGTGIISTVPTPAGSPARYLSMNGTSMSTPMVTATLAACLAGDQEYVAMPGNLDRFMRAAEVVFSAASHSLHLSPLYQGLGMMTCNPFA